MALFTFPDGRTVRLRPMYVLDELAFDDLVSIGDELERARSEMVTAKNGLEAAGTDDEKADALAPALAAVEQFQRAYHAQLRAVYTATAAAVEETSWGGELGARVTSEELFQLARRWRHATEDEALPPV